MRTAYLVLGWFFVATAVIGAVLPLLPSTPFLIVASACFMRSDSRYSEHLRRSPLFGPALRDWHENRVVRPQAKIFAIGTMVLSGGVTLSLGEFTREFAGLALGLMAIVAGVILRLPSIRSC